MKITITTNDSNVIINSDGDIKISIEDDNKHTSEYSFKNNNSESSGLFPVEQKSISGLFQEGHYTKMEGGTKKTFSPYVPFSRFIK